MKQAPRKAVAAGKKRATKPARGKTVAGHIRTHQRARKSAPRKNRDEKPPRAPTNPFKLLALANAILLQKKEAKGTAATTGARPEDWTPSFLEALRRNGGYIRPACRLVQVAASNVYARIESDPEFAAGVETAREDAIEEAEAALHIRGVYGTEKPVWFQGIRVGSDLEYSDGNLAKFLEAKRPGVYGKKTTLQNPDGSAFSITVHRVADEQRVP